MVEQNTVKVDSNIDHFLNHDVEQHTLLAEEGLGFIDPVDVFVSILVVKTNEPLIDQSM